MGTIAYELREERKETFTGGTIALADGSTFNVGEELSNGAGRIEVDDRQSLLTAQLDEYPALKRVKGTGEETVQGYAHRNASDLRQILARRRLATGGNKPDLVTRLEAHDELLERGESAPEGSKPEEILAELTTATTTPEGE